MIKKNFIKENVKIVILGIIVGIGGILPGISGGILCVIFGIYEILMETIAHPFKKIFKNAKIIFPFAIGVLIGFFGFANIINSLLINYSNYIFALFLGLTIGMLPSTFKEASKEGTNKKCWIIFGISLVISFLLFLLFEIKKLQLPLNFISYFICGFAWGISIIIPGLSSSIIIIFLGLYKPMTSGISRLDINVLIPLFIGILITIVTLSKLVDYLFKKNYATFYHFILGFIISSIIFAFPKQFSSFSDLIVQIIFIIIGFIISYFLDYFINKNKNFK